MWTSFIRNPKDFWSGAIFIVIGAGAIVIGLDYRMGTAGHMGPAYFPSVLGGILILIGLVAVVRSCVSDGEPLEKFDFKKAALVLGSTVLFGVLVRNAGLFVAIVALVMAGGLASSRFKTKPYIALALGMATFSVLVFVKALGVPMPVIGSWFGF